MKNKKTVYIWFLIILEVLSLPFLLIALFDDSYTGNVILGYIGIFFNIIGAILSIVWLYKTFFLKKDLIKWTNINFGFSIFVLLFSSVGIYINTKNIILATAGNLFSLAIYLIIWFTFIKHIKKSVSNGRIKLN